jgi:hypothetical protein
MTSRALACSAFARAVPRVFLQHVSRERHALARTNAASAGAGARLDPSCRKAMPLRAAT